MPTSSYMVSLDVDIAFNAGFLTPAASRTWTNVWSYVELDKLITITVGRGDERSEADANHLTLTLDNRDGRFTPGKTGGAYYPNVLLNRPIRVTGTPVDGSAQVEFLGFIDEWPPEWSDGTDATNYVTISASSRLSRLGTQAALSSIVEIAMLADAPAAYYTLGEPSGSLAANDSSGNRRNPLRSGVAAGTAVVFGNATGLGTDGLTAVQFAGGDYLRSPGTYASTTTTLSLLVAFRVTATPAIPTGGELLLAGLLGPFGVGGVGASAPQIYMNSSGALRARADYAVTILSPAGNYADGAWHVAELVESAGIWTLYVDGASVASGPGSTPLSTGIQYDLALGADSDSPAGTSQVAIAHVAVFATANSAAQVALHATAGLNGFAGDTTSARLIRYAGYAGILAAEVVTETGQATVQHVDTTDKQAVELMRLMETTEGGVLFDGRDGLTYFQNRAHRLTESAVFTLDMAQQMVESDYSPKLDRTVLFNDVTAQDISGQFTAHVFDTQSRNVDNGVATASIETASQDDDEPLFQASWMVYKYKQPAVRIASLSVDCLAQVGKAPNCATVLAANVGDKFTVSNRPAQDSSSSASFFVEGYTRVYGPESCRTTFNLSSSSPDDTTYIVGNATGRGVIGTNPIAL